MGIARFHKCGTLNRMNDEHAAHYLKPDKPQESFLADDCHGI